MEFRELFHPRFKSDIKKLDKSVAKEVKTKHLDIIIEDPLKYSKLTGRLSDIYSYHFRQNRVEYRIAYEITNEKIIFYYMIAKRENFYQKLEMRVDNQ